MSETRFRVYRQSADRVGTNNITVEDFTIFNMHYNEENDTVELLAVASYSPDKAVILKIFSDI